MRSSSFFILLPVILLTACAPQTPAAPAPAESVSATCIRSCEEARTAGKELDAGPCLLDPVQQDADWVCDVAHDPRQPVDNQPENQCQAFRSGVAHHFVEVTPECEVIKIY